MEHTLENKPVAVIGNGWSAIGAVGLLLSARQNVRWVRGTGGRFFAPVPVLGAESEFNGISAWNRLFRFLDIDSGEPETGSFLREHRNKSFRQPAWVHAPTPGERKEVRDEILWKCERRFAPVFEARFPLTLVELEEKVRAKLNSTEFSNLTVTEEIPVEALQTENGKVSAVILSSGEKILCESVIYADRWSVIHRIQGLPRPIPFIGRFSFSGVIQVTFQHQKPVGAGLLEGFFIPLPKDSTDSIERHLWGCFSLDGMRSFWSVCLTPSEVEDNHEIAKKLRKLKNALNKVFSTGGWLPEGSSDFMSNVSSESVRLEEQALLEEAPEAIASITLPGLLGLTFLTDGYGPSGALFQVERVLKSRAPLVGSEAQAKDVDLGNSNSNESSC